MLSPNYENGIMSPEYTRNIMNLRMHDEVVWNVNPFPDSAEGLIRTANVSKPAEEAGPDATP